MLKLEYTDYTLEFKFDAGTSRGILKQHKIILLKIYDEMQPLVYGIGEAAPLLNLSPEKFHDLENQVINISKILRSHAIPDKINVSSLVHSIITDDFPSLKFGLETALYDLINGGKRIVFQNDFHLDSRSILINGLIWMGDSGFMKRQIDEKIEAGFKCIKLKVGAIDFDEEVEILSYLRDKAPDITIRIDANGGFKNNEVLNKLNTLSVFDIHSIEQPIMPGQWEAMQLVCEKSPIPIALDEELIGISGQSRKTELLKYLRPSYLVLKPTLIGGFHQTIEWIQIANQQGIKWWLTSALESNIGLNAIAQFACEFDDISYQGLGTGQLYVNNFDSPLEINGEFLSYNLNKKWAIDAFY